MKRVLLFLPQHGEVIGPFYQAIEANVCRLGRRSRGWENFISGTSLELPATRF
jgi:hypothetical protein